MGEESEGVDVRGEEVVGAKVNGTEAAGVSLVGRRAGVRGGRGQRRSRGSVLRSTDRTLGAGQK